MWQEIGFEKTVIFEVLGKQKKLHSFLEGTQESSEYKGPYGDVAWTWQFSLKKSPWTEDGLL